MSTVQPGRAASSVAGDGVAGAPSGHAHEDEQAAMRDLPEVVHSGNAALGGSGCLRKGAAGCTLPKCAYRQAVHADYSLPHGVSDKTKALVEKRIPGNRFVGLFD